MVKFIEWEEVDEPWINPDPGPKPTHEITDRHWLEVYECDDPGSGNWDYDGIYDYEVTHECKWFDAGGYWHPSCALQWEMDNIGSDVFDPEWKDWPKPPFKVEILHHYSTFRTYEGDWDVDSWVEIVK